MGVVRIVLILVIGGVRLTAACGCHLDGKREGKFILELMPSRSSAIP